MGILTSLLVDTKVKIPTLSQNPRQGWGTPDYDSTAARTGIAHTAPSVKFSPSIPNA